MHKFTAWRTKGKRESRRKHTCCLESLKAVKSAYKKASQALDAVKLAVMTEIAKASKFYKIR